MLGPRVSGGISTPEKKCKRTCGANPNLGSHLRSPTSPRHIGDPRLGYRVALDPGDGGADDGGDVDGYDDEPDKAFGHAGREPQQGYGEGRLGPAQSGDGEGRPAAEDDQELGQVVDFKRPAVPAQLKLVDQGSG